MAGDGGFQIIHAHARQRACGFLERDDPRNGPFLSRALLVRRHTPSVPLPVAWLSPASDRGSPVDDADYKTPFTFTGRLGKIALTVDRPKLSPDDIKKLEAAARNNKASE